MAATARRRVEPEPPPIDPSAVERAFALHRARRRARIEHRQELKRARRRFWALLGALLFLAVFLSLTIWDQIQALFGL